MYTVAFAAFAASLSVGASATSVASNGSQSTIKYNTTYVNGGLNWTGQQYIYGTKVLYDSATGTYTVRDTGSTTTTSSFSNANKTGSDVKFDYYSKSASGVTETFKVLKPGALGLTYVRYGKWRRTGLSGTFKSNDTYVVFGTPTTAAQMPHSGSATYATVYEGTWVDKNGLYSVNSVGGSSLTANFGTNTLSFAVTLEGTKEGGGSPIAFGAFNGTGSISSYGPVFSGKTATYNANGYKMTINGGFYGPPPSAGAAPPEVGGNFSLSGDWTHSGSGTGAFVGSNF